MSKIMKLLALVMALAMVLCLGACGGNDNPTTEPAGTTESSTPVDNKDTTDTTDASEPDDGMKTYTVTLKDSQGNPHAGVMVQICLESCMPGVTDANGVATFKQVEASGYSVGVMSDYESTKVYYEDGQYDVTIVWDPSVAE